MPVEIEIPESSLTGFTGQAREHLKDTVVTYANDVIEEANRLEAGSNSASGPPEVTRSMVNGAEVLVRHGLGTSRSALKSKILRVVAAVLSLSVGVLYNEESLQDRGYLLLFILLVAAAILTVTVSTLRE